MIKGKLQNRDIIMIGIQPWDFEIGCNFKDMAFEIARHNRVLYVNRPLDRITAYKLPDDVKTKNRKKSIQDPTSALQEVEKNLWVFNPRIVLESINWMAHHALYRFLNKRNNKKQAKQINWAISKLHFKNPILFIDNDFFNGLYLPDFLDVDCTVYYIRDFLLAQPYFNKHGKISEPELIKKADAVVANSLYLASYARQYNANSTYIGQGCGPDYFRPVPDTFPADIIHINKPVIGYCGFLTAARLDIDLLVSISKARPHWNLVLVGPEDESFKNSALHQLSNVYFLGRKEEKDLPDYVNYFDVCLNPQSINQLTMGNYPRKVDEYLAAGKPVVATRTETMEAFADCTYLCTGTDDYIKAIELALAEKEDIARIEKRKEVARSHSWENSIAAFYGVVESLNK